MLRYKLTNKTKVMSYDEYSDYMRLESSILFTDLTYKPRRTLRNGYDHLYNEFEPLFKRLEIQEVRDICSKCLNFSKDITKFEELKKYLQYEPVRTYIRFIASRYNPVLSAYDKKELLEYCDEILRLYLSDGYNTLNKDNLDYLFLNIHLFYLVFYSYN